MEDFISRHRHSIQFVVWMGVGIVFISVGLYRDSDPALIALGAGAIGLPGFQSLTKRGESDED